MIKQKTLHLQGFYFSTAVNQYNLQHPDNMIFINTDKLIVTDIGNGVIGLAIKGPNKENQRESRTGQAGKLPL